MTLLFLARLLLWPSRKLLTFFGTTCWGCITASPSPKVRSFYAEELASRGFWKFVGNIVSTVEKEERKGYRKKAILGRCGDATVPVQGTYCYCDQRKIQERIGEESLVKVKRMWYNGERDAISLDTNRFDWDRQKRREQSQYRISSLVQQCCTNVGPLSPLSRMAA